MSGQDQASFQATALLLNWKRPGNLARLIKSIRSQSVPIEILLWNNSVETTSYNVDLQINSSVNLMCWPRWMLASYATAEYIFTMDDDIMPGDTRFISDCIDYCRDNPGTAVGYTGVIFNSRKKYWSSKHLSHPARHIDLQVDVIKGQFIFMPKPLLQDLSALPQASLYDPRIEDDIIISSSLKTKVLPKFLYSRLKKLPEGNVALWHQPAHRQSRQQAVARYFS
jgi:hypothetical protein